MAKASIKEFAFEQEATPGVAETLVSADLLVRLRTASIWTPEADLFETEEVQGNSSPRPISVGRKIIRAPIEYLLRGPGDLSTAPSVVDLFEAAMFDYIAAKTIVIGAVTNGPFQAGEIITGGTSTATGMVLQQTATGSSPLPYIPLTGTFQNAETITGGTSGATATSGGTPQNGGAAFRLADIADSNTPGHHGTFRGLMHNGTYYEGRGALGSIEFRFENGRPVVVAQEFVGAFSAHGDGALFNPTAYPEDAITPPRALAVGLKFGSYTAQGIVGWTLRIPVGVAPVEDANDAAADGVTEMDYDRLNNPPELTIDPKLVTVATHDPLTALKNGTLFNCEWTIGATQGSRWTFVLPKAQITGFGFGSREPDLATTPLTIRATGTNNNEILIWQH